MSGSDMSEEYEVIPSYDVVVIGGGINGVGIATDASGRGLSVLLCEKDDLAQHTSSASSKLIHGGLRYLEQGAFRLVRESLTEREILLRKAPHLVQPMRFIMPHQPHLRAAWLIRTGLFFYDHLAKRKKLPASRFMRFDPQHSSLQEHISQGFEYSDCCVDDARLVVLNALQARENGAEILTSTRCIAAQRRIDHWLVRLENSKGEFEIKAKALVNAAGPWVAAVIENQIQEKTPHQLRLIQGSHIVLPRIYTEKHAFIFQNIDRRVIFAIPYLEKYTLVGTTDREYFADPHQVQIHPDEIDYLLEVSNRYFKKQHTEEQIVHSFSGLRALPDDAHDRPSTVTRDYQITLSLDQHRQLPLLSVFGGKLTTYRKLAEQALTQLSEFFPEMGESWTAEQVLPGAEQWTSLDDLMVQIRQQLPHISLQLARRWALAYGTRIWKILHGAQSTAQLGALLAPDLYAAEVDYLVAYEWAKTSQDILWRRTKLGLQFSQADIVRLEHYLESLGLEMQQNQIA